MRAIVILNIRQAMTLKSESIPEAVKGYNTRSDASICCFPVNGYGRQTKSAWLVLYVLHCSVLCFCGGIIALIEASSAAAEMALVKDYRHISLFWGLSCTAAY